MKTTKFALLIVLAGCAPGRETPPTAKPEADVISEPKAAVVRTVNPAEVPEPLRLAARPTPASPGELAGVNGLFAPREDTPDHTLTLKGGKDSDPVRVVRRHGAWARIDLEREGASERQHVHIPSGFVLTRTEFTDGSHVLTIQVPTPTPWVDHGSFKTNLRKRVVGERCEVWDVYRGMESGRATFRSFACVTPDGVTVEQRTRYSSDHEEVGATAVRLRRGPVAASVVRPPALTAALWSGDAPRPIGPETPGSFEVVLKDAQRGDVALIRRGRSGSSTEERRPDGSATLSVSGAGQQQAVTAQIGPGGVPESLTVWRRTAPPSPGREAVPLDRPPETVLGLSCRWFDTMPGVMDAGEAECRTADGVPLRRERYARGATMQDFTAVHLDRRALTPDEVLPPAALLDLKLWGVSD